MTRTAAPDARIVTTAGLRKLIKKGEKHDFNRQLRDDLPLDPDGVHVLALALFGHNMDRKVVFHHRAYIYMKFTGDADPHMSMIDIADEDWQKLPHPPGRAKGGK